MLKTMVKKLRSGITDPFFKYQYQKRTSKTFSQKVGKYAVVNFDDNFRLDDYSRYLYAVCLYFEKAGYKLVVKTGFADYKKFREASGYQRRIWKGGYEFVRECATPLNSILLVQPNASDHLIRFTCGFAVADGHGFDFVAPFPMHPFQFKYLFDASFMAERRNAGRTIKLLFSGRTLKSVYTEERVATFFDHLSRREVVQFVLDRFHGSSRWLKDESDKAKFTQLLDSVEYANEVVISEVKSDPEDWLKILSKADFFICPPGAKMPWCHNCIEAMSVGCIPILEYGNLFNPELVHGKNCLRFSGRDELEAVITEALAMEPMEIARMRQNVIAYFDKHLSVKGIVEKINHFASLNDYEINVAVPFIPTLEEKSVIPRPQW